MRNVALDLGARKIAFCEIVDGQVKERRTVTSLSALDDVLGPTSPPARVAFEACREAWKLHERIKANGHEPLLVDTTRIHQIGIPCGRKTDRIDAELLARAVERGILPLAHVLSKEAQQLRASLSVRRALVETRSQMIVTVRGLVRAGGEKIAGCDTEHFVERAKAASLGGDEALRALISPLIELLEQVGKQLTVLDAELDARSKADPLVVQLTSAPGVGPVVATAYISVIDSAKRFRNAHQVAAYVGLVPKEDSSGGRRKLGSITKQGNAYLRTLLVQAAWNVMRQRGDDPMKTWAQAVAKRRGKRVAVVAVARRLAGVLWAMWRDGTLYHAPEVAAASARGMTKHAKQIHRRAEQLTANTE